MNYASLGSISTGTLLSRDLTVSFHYELNRLASRDDDDERKAATLLALDSIKQLVEQDEEDSEADISALEHFVNEVAPELFGAYCAPYTYFGTHEGDGSDFGIWPDVQGLEDAARYDDGVLKLNAGDEWPEIAEGVFHVMEVNDHGNVSLYDAHTKTEVWSCV